MEVKKENHAGGQGLSCTREKKFIDGGGGGIMQHKKGFIELEGSSSSRMSIMYRMRGI